VGISSFSRYGKIGICENPSFAKGLSFV